MIQEFQSSKDSYTQAKQNLSDDKDKLMGMIFQAAITSMDVGITRNQAKKAKIEEKLQKFLAFCDQSTSYFDGLSDTGNLLSKGMQALGVNGNGSIGPGSWNGKGFSLKDTSWMKDVNKRWNDRHQTSEQKFVRNLKDQYGFDDETIKIIMDLKANIDEKYPELTQKERDYLFNRLLGGLSYGDKDASWMNKLQWQNTAGGMRAYFPEFSLEEDMFKYLGLSVEEYNMLRYKLRIQNNISASGDALSWINLKKDQKEAFKKRMEQGVGYKLSDYEFKKLWNQQFSSMNNKNDFPHQSITTATNLMDSWRLADTLKGGHENINNLSGWKGDATLKGSDGLVSFGADDYKADLDAENIIYLMRNNNLSYDQAFNKYYSEVGKNYSRSELFLKYENLKDVKQQILSDLNINTMEELKQKQPDAYQFIKNLENKTNELGAF